MSSSSSSEDEEEFSVLSLLLDEDEKGPKDLPPSKIREVTPAVVATSGQESEFEIRLPSVFLYDAKRNEKLDKTNERLQEAMVQEELKILQDFHDLVRKKQKLLHELNDNGSGGIKTFHIDHDKHLIEKYVRATYENTTVNRHCYFFANVYKVSMKEFRPSGQVKFPFPTSHFFLELLPNKFQSNWTRIRPVLDQFIYFCLENVTNLDHLRQVDKFLEKVHYHENVNSLDEYPQIDILKTLAKIGACVSFVTLESAPLKLYQFNNHAILNVIRSSLILKSHMLLTFSPELMIKVFVLILSDFNLNKFATKDLDVFTRSIFSLMVKKCRLSSEKFVQLFNSIIRNSLDTHLFNETQTIPLKKQMYELRFNVLRWLNIAFASCTDRTLLAIITSINLSFLEGSDYLVTISNILLTPSLALLKSLFDKIASTKIVDGIENNDYSIINQFYYDYYKIALLHFVLLESFENNSPLGSSSYEKIRASNVKRLHKLISLISNLKDILHANIGKVSYSYTDTDTLLNRLEVAKHITESFYTLNHIYNQAENDLNLIKDDIFYSFGV